MGMYENYGRLVERDRRFRDELFPSFSIFCDGGPIVTKVKVPALEVPPAPVEPAPEPESASVQLLRSLLAERRAELDRVTDARRSRQAQVDDAERRAAELRTRVAQDDRHITAAEAAIADIEADIAKLGGRGDA